MPISAPARGRGRVHQRQCGRARSRPIRGFGELVGLPAYAVGARTRAAAVTAGFAKRRRRMAMSTRSPGIAANELHATGLPFSISPGSDRAGDLAGALGRAGQSVATVIAYRAMVA